MSWQTLSCWASRVGQDLALGRPSAAIDLGLSGAIEHFEALVQAAVNAVPEGAGFETMRQLVRQEAERLVPRSACDLYRRGAPASLKQIVA